MKQMMRTAVHEEVLSWPEWKAFAERLGIPPDLWTTSLMICLPGQGQFVKVVHEYTGMDHVRAVEDVQQAARKGFQS
jgi:hypothetical protein